MEYSHFQLSYILFTLHYLFQNKNSWRAKKMLCYDVITSVFQCTQKCGKKGRQVRVLNCINMTSKEKVPRHLCPRNLKPPRKRKCNQWRCLYKSCREIKHYTQTKENKDYIISLRGRPVQIYCYKMDTPVPQEYISLHPDTNNYAEIYDRR